MTSSWPLHAELVEDGGAAASDPQFFRCPPFLRAEGVTHSLVVGGGVVVLPVVRREIPDGAGFDAVSPYGYPGGAVRGGRPHVDDVDFAGTGLVSLFLRERLGEPTLRGGVQRAAVLLHDPAAPRTVHRRVAAKARSNARRGYRVETVPGPAVDDTLLGGFADAYGQTMRRAGAARRYLFGVDYLRCCLSFDASWLVVAHGPDGDLAAAAVAAVSDGYLHFFLGGTADAHRGASPAKNVMIAMMDLADTLSLPLNLGGSVTPGDGVHGFKSAFANAEDGFVTHSVVGDADAYAALVGDRPVGDFFPAYRAAPVG